MNDAVVMIAAHECKRAIEKVRAAGGTFEEECQAAMDESHNFYMSTDDNIRFMGACAAILELADDATKQRVLDECESIKMLNAMLSGVPIDWSQVKELENPIGLLKMYKAKGGQPV